MVQIRETFNILAGLERQIFSASDIVVAVYLVKLAADEYGWILLSGQKDESHHRGGRRFPVGARYRYRIFIFFITAPSSSALSITGTPSVLAFTSSGFVSDIAAV